MTRRFLCALTARFTRATWCSLLVEPAHLRPRGAYEVGPADRCGRRRPSGRPEGLEGWEGLAAEEALHLLGVALGEADVEVEPPGARGRLVLEQVLAVGLLAHELACAGHLDPL